MSTETLALSVPTEPLFISHVARDLWTRRLNGLGHKVVDVPGGLYVPGEEFSEEDRQTLKQAGGLMVALCSHGASLPLDQRSAEHIRYVLEECHKPVFADSPLEAEKLIQRAGVKLGFDPGRVTVIDANTDFDKINETLAGVR